MTAKKQIFLFSNASTPASAYTASCSMGTGSFLRR